MQYGCRKGVNPTKGGYTVNGVRETQGAKIAIVGTCDSDLSICNDQSVAELAREKESCYELQRWPIILLSKSGYNAMEVDEPGACLCIDVYY